MSKEITVDEFAKQTKERLDRFVSYWKKNASKQGDFVPGVPFSKAFPLKMLPGDWDEQEAMFEDT